MGNRSYPVIGQMQPQRKSGRVYFTKKRKCQLCGKISEKGKSFIIDIQVNYFRGDDEVFLICSKCASKQKDKLLSELFEKILGDSK
ncbi:MAG: hypothetical protein DRQ46_00045 [Gammaproteobacteria bacterium]|nr:MAG: hypothetical protein DRQ46_00045 [Gammaproteobacteria bacterium]